jgi:hypothetical protein
MRLLVVALGLLFLTSVPTPSHAQWRSPAGVRAREAALPGLPAPRLTALAESSVWRYVGRGALIGAMTLGLVVYVAAIDQDNDCLGCSPYIIAPIVLGTGAILGAAVGYVVYRARRSRPAAER